MKETAFQLIAEGGISNLTMSALAKRSGYSTAIVGYHFGSKNNFIQHLVDDLFEQNISTMTDPLVRDDFAKEIPLLFSNVAKYVEENRATVGAYLTLLSSANESNPALLKIVQHQNQRVIKTLEAVIKKAQSRGKANRNVSANALAISIIGLIRGVTMQAMVDSQLSVNAALSTMADGVVALLGGKQND
ncbi:MAG: TetR/AcrR family transcriptional regulator [Gammaproteobacteria bacterium]|nr:TetR/AcrR family transcriptional regulator [Gammaproteobacteria bacterium]